MAFGLIWQTKIWYKASNMVPDLERDYSSLLYIPELRLFNDEKKIGKIAILCTGVRGSLNRHLYENDERKATEISDCFEEYRLKDRDITITHFNDLSADEKKFINPSITKHHDIPSMIYLEKSLKNVEYIRNILIETYKRVYNK